MQERLGQIGDFWLSKRPGSGQWCRTWYEGTSRQTRRASLGTDDLEAAKLALYAWYTRHGKLKGIDPTDAPLELILARYYEQHAKQQVSADTARAALLHWSDYFAGALVSEVTIARQEGFIASLQAKGLADGTIKRILTVGKAALARAHRRGEIASAPYVMLWHDGPARDRILDQEESRALWRAADVDHERMFLALAFNTLARPEAILDLRREFADLQGRTLDQNPPGRKQTKKRRPVVPITDTLLPWLQNAPGGPLVTWRGVPIRSFKSAWRGLRRRAGVGQEVVSKTIRYTMATELRRRGVPEAEIQGMLGHRAFKGPTEVYARFRPDYLGHAARAIDDYMGALRSSCVLVSPGASS